MPTISSTSIDQGSPPSSHLHHPYYHPRSPLPPTTTEPAPASHPPVDSRHPVPATPAVVAPSSTHPASTSAAPSFPPSTSGFTGSVIGSISRRNRRSFAALAREKTSSAIANLSSIGGTTAYPLRSSASSGSLSKHSRKPSQVSISEAAGISPLTPPPSDGSAGSEQSSPAPIEPATNPFTAAEHLERRRQTLQHVPSSVPQLSQAGPAVPPSKMHQTSSRLLRMTEDDRPFTKVSRRKLSVGY